MIEISRSFDLGKDKTRMKDPRDAARQHTTVKEILNRFFNRNPKKRFEIQILADEVGMGKTFVALATAFSILESMRNGYIDPDLAGCYQRVLIITPQNQALFSKWIQEVGEFVKRCVTRERDQAQRLFSPVRVERIDELAATLRRPGVQPDIIVTNTGIFQGRTLIHYKLKRQVILGLLFRYWGNRFRYELRKNLLKGAPWDWPRNPDHLCELTDDEQEQLFFNLDEMYSLLFRVARLDDIGRDSGSLESLLELCREIAQPYTRDRDRLFNKVNARITELYKTITGMLIRQAFPLVIVDEAHNWKNGPSQGTNGFFEFTRFVACNARRVLLLTATPFQLNPEEMLEILKVSDHIEPCPTKNQSIDRRNRLERYREETIRPVLRNAARASRKFSREWSRLPRHVSIDEITGIWNTDFISSLRTKLEELADARGEIDQNQMDNFIRETLKQVHPDFRIFFREALRLYAFNRDLSHELGAIVIRHRRQTEHRLFRVGCEIDAETRSLALRGDRHVLHSAAGLDVRGNGELPHYLLMRCVTEMKKAKGRRGRSSLGSALTGCYSTLQESSEGREIQKWLISQPSAKVYFDLLSGMVSPEQDTTHPKIKRIVEEVISNWKRGEKTLLFCFRINTAQRLREIIDDKIREELNERRQRCLGGEKQLEYFRSRITGRERDLVVLGLDRVLLSLLVYAVSLGCETENIRDSFNIDQAILEKLARLSLCYKVDVMGERVDRVFLFRAIEHAIAKRIRTPESWPAHLKYALKLIQSEDWIERPYGIGSEQKDDAEGEDKTAFDERGAHSVYEVKAEPSQEEISTYALRMSETRDRARKTGQTAILDSYMESPSLWLGITPALIVEKPNEVPGSIRKIHSHCWLIMMNSGNELNWEPRRKVFQALRRAVLRNSVILRLLPERAELEESSWGQLLVESFFSALPGQSESMADRLSVFLEDIDAASGDLSTNNPDLGGAKLALYEATRLTDQQFVALVKGGGGKSEMARRNRVFTGFNTPLLPEVLICTQVGQEGIDLHRHCRHVIHYDLAWNPAVLEQRTGRADRIGSKTFRERELYDGDAKPFMEIAVPYLAGTYDERMYEELRIRAQMFEVLTGGDIASENREGLIGDKDDEGKEGGYVLLGLPDPMTHSLRVNLHVWEDDQAVSLPER